MYSAHHSARATDSVMIDTKPTKPQTQSKAGSRIPLGESVKVNGGHNAPPPGAPIFRIHLSTRALRQLPSLCDESPLLSPLDGLALRLDATPVIQRKAAPIPSAPNVTAPEPMSKHLLALEAQSQWKKLTEQAAPLRQTDYHAAPLWPPRGLSPPRYSPPRFAIATPEVTYTRGLRDDRDPVILGAQARTPVSRAWLEDMSPLIPAQRGLPPGLSSTHQPPPHVYLGSDTVRDDNDEIGHLSRASPVYNPTPIGHRPSVLQRRGAGAIQQNTIHKSTQRATEPNRTPTMLSHNGITFTLTASIANGAAGRVVSAEHGGKTFAIKAIQKWRAYKAYWYTRAEFVRERDAMVHISKSGRTPYLAQLLMAWEEPEIMYFVMPQYPLDIRARLDSAPITENDKLLYCAELIAAIQTLWKLGIVHHDIKPSNILIDNDGRAVLSDFGLATVVSEGTYSTWRDYNQCGTPAYMAPEIVARDHTQHGHGGAVDVWSLGIVFLEIFGLADRWCLLVPDFEEARKLHQLLLPIRLDLPANMGETPSALLPKMLKANPSERIAVGKLHAHVPPDTWCEVSRGTQSHDWLPGQAPTSEASPGRCLDFTTFEANEKRFERCHPLTNAEADMRRAFEEEQAKANVSDFEYLAPGAFESG